MTGSFLQPWWQDLLQLLGLRQPWHHVQAHVHHHDATARRLGVPSRVVCRGQGHVRLEANQQQSHTAQQDEVSGTSMLLWADRRQQAGQVKAGSEGHVQQGRRAGQTGMFTGTVKLPWAD